VAGRRPGELATRGVAERLDAARAGQPAPGAGAAADSAELAALSARVDELAQRLDALAAPAPALPVEATVAPKSAETATPKRRGRPPKAAAETRRSTSAAAGRVPLHEEIIAVISERGPMTAGDLAAAIKERGRYTSPRSAKPFDATTVNARVSNPVYRSRFTRDKGRIGLANAG
jgi:hypothetical protein